MGGHGHPDLLVILAGSPTAYCLQVFAIAEIVCRQPAATPKAPLFPSEDHGSVSGLHTSPVILEAGSSHVAAG